MQPSSSAFAAPLQFVSTLPGVQSASDLQATCLNELQRHGLNLLVGTTARDHETSLDSETVVCCAGGRVGQKWKRVRGQRVAMLRLGCRHKPAGGCNCVGGLVGFKGSCWELGAAVLRFVCTLNLPAPGRAPCICVCQGVHPITEPAYQRDLNTQSTQYTVNQRYR